MSMSAKRWLPVLAGMVMILGGCDSIREAAGITKEPPDEFAVVTKSPLVIPPDYNLRPPRTGSSPTNQVAPTVSAETTLFRRHGTLRCRGEHDRQLQHRRKDAARHGACRHGRSCSAPANRYRGFDARRGCELYRPAAFRRTQSRSGQADRPERGSTAPVRFQGGADGTGCSASASSCRRATPSTVIRDRTARCRLKQSACA